MSNVTVNPTFEEAVRGGNRTDRLFTTLDRIAFFDRGSSGHSTRDRNQRDHAFDVVKSEIYGYHIV